jgi:PAS domain S-box-containing protein
MVETRESTGREEPDEAHLRLLIETVTDYAIFTTDPQGQVVTWNSGAQRILGYEEAEILGKNSSIFFTPEDIRLGEHERELRTAAAEGRAEDERWHVRKDGSRFWASGVVIPLRDAVGRHRGFGKVMRDITGRKRMEDELAASEARFRSIAEQSPVLIWRSAADGGYDYFNRPWYDFRGRGPDQELASGFAWAEGIHPEDRDRYLTTYRSAFEKREPFESTFRLLRGDGQYRWVIDRGNPYRDPQGNFLGYLGSYMDITERVELEAVLRQQRELAEEAGRHKARLLSALSHDARTPLNAVVLAAQLLEMRLQGLADPEVEQDLRTIRHAVGNVLDLLGDLLNLARIDSGADPTAISRFSLEPVLAECLSGIEPQARQKGLDVRLEPGELAGAVLESDRAKLKQILSNLLSNALRYTQRGHVRLYVERDDDGVRIAVEDSGIGIEPADQPRVFEEFARLDQPHRPVGEGTGLGLAICRRLASLLGGEVGVRSAPGRGSTFTVSLPPSVLVHGPTAGPLCDPVAPEPSPTGTILVVEDHLASRQTLARVLRRMGYRVLEAANGRDALAVVRRERPQAILMDVNMPVMDGVEATLALRSEPTTRDVPIFALTCDVSVVNQRRIGEAGVDGYLEKPVVLDALKQALSILRDRPL